MKTLFSVSYSSAVYVITAVSYSQYTNEEKSRTLLLHYRKEKRLSIFTEMFNKYNKKVFENIMSARKHIRIMY
ncbi:MAG: hypothetical protein IPI04_16175 [Ignavibacteria bacterium]|nr:hypothetical protein [Ignavibacteria bacterium]